MILWAENLGADAMSIPSTGNAYRIQIINAYMTSYKPSFDDKLKSAEVTFKWAPFDKSAAANKREESTQSSADDPLPSAITTAISF